MADETDTVTIRSEVGEERDVPKVAVPYFTNQGWVVLTSDGRVNSRATAASNTTKES